MAATPNVAHEQSCATLSQVISVKQSASTREQVSPQEKPTCYVVAIADGRRRGDLNLAREPD